LKGNYNEGFGSKKLTHQWAEAHAGNSSSTQNSLIENDSPAIENSFPPAKAKAAKSDRNSASSNRSDQTEQTPPPTEIEHLNPSSIKEVTTTTATSSLFGDDFDEMFSRQQQQQPTNNATSNRKQNGQSILEKVQAALQQSSK